MPCTEEGLFITASLSILTGSRGYITLQASSRTGPVWGYFEGEMFFFPPLTTLFCIY